MDNIQLKIQMHAELAVNRSIAILGEYFAICRRNIDIDGVDFLVQEIETKTNASVGSTGAIYPGFIQVKYFQSKTRVKIERSYILTGKEARPDFFVFLHTDDNDGNRDHYFFSADEVAAKWNIGKNDKFYSFSILNRNAFDSVRNLDSDAIADKISAGIQRSRSAESSGAVSRFYKYRVDTRVMYDIERDFEYHFLNVNGCSIVLCRLTESETTRLLEPRRDLFQYTGDFKWGYRGTGPQFLVASLLGHFLGDEWTKSQFDNTLDLVSIHPQESDWKISTSELTAILGPNQ